MAHPPDAPEVWVILGMAIRALGPLHLYHLYAVPCVERASAAFDLCEGRTTCAALTEVTRGVEHRA